MGTQKINQPLLAPSQIDPITIRITEPGSGVVIKDQPMLVRRCRLTLSAATLSVTAALDYGSLKVVDLPDRNMLLLAVEADLVLTKQGNTNGIITTTDLDVGMGTAAASATTLATTMIDILEKVDIDGDTLAVDFERHSNDQSTATFPKRIVDGASSALYLNAVAIGGITADSSLSCSGTIDIYYVDLGKAV